MDDYSTRPHMPGQDYPGGPMRGEVYTILEQQRRQEEEAAAAQTPGLSDELNLLLLFGP